MDQVDPNVLSVLVTGVIVPFVVTGIRKVFPKIPKFWFPVIATLAPAVFDAIILLFNNSSFIGNPWLAAIAGAAGTGFYELKKQIGAMIDDEIKKSLPMLLLAIPLVALLGGCSGKALITEEQTPQAQAIEAIGKAESVLIVAWKAVQGQQGAGVFTDEELREMAADLARAGAILDRAYRLVASGYLENVRQALNDAKTQEAIVSAIQRRIAERLNQRRSSHVEGRPAHARLLGA